MSEEQHASISHSTRYFEQKELIDHCKEMHKEFKLYKEPAKKMSEGNKWKSPESAPKDGNPILADVGYPWAVVAAWNSHDEKWVYASLQACEMENNTVDTYFENEQESEIKGWLPMPELP